MWCRSRTGNECRGEGNERKFMASVMKQFEASSQLFGANAPFIEELYESYLADPQSVSGSWKALFDSWQGEGRPKDVAHSRIIAAFEERARNPLAGAARGLPPTGTGSEAKALK